MTSRDGKREEPGAGRGICTSRCRWRGGAVSALQSMTFPVHTSRNRGRWRRVRRREGGRGVVCLCPSAEAFALLQRQKVVLAWSCLGPLTGCGLGMLLCTFPYPGNQKRVLLSSCLVSASCQTQLWAEGEDKPKKTFKILFGKVVGENTPHLSSKFPSWPAQDAQLMRVS